MDGHALRSSRESACSRSIRAGCRHSHVLQSPTRARHKSASDLRWIRVMEIQASLFLAFDVEIRTRRSREHTPVNRSIPTAQASVYKESSPTDSNPEERYL